METKFTIDGARTFAEEGKIEEWVHLFLYGIRNNKALSAVLKLEKRHWTGPNLMELKNWAATAAQRKIWNISSPRKPGKTLWMNAGWSPPPLIAERVKDKLILRDGNHHHEAMSKLGWGKYWVIIVTLTR